MTLHLTSPVTGAALRPDTPWSLAAPGERWPVVDAIPYLRTGRADLVAAVLDRLDAGDRVGALARLLADQDDWWDGPTPAEAGLAALVRDASDLSLRDAMARLAFGRVGDYFAHRWSDPTYLAGLALLDAHWEAPTRAFELACGIGHYLRDLRQRDVAVAGGDVVFAKLWLARNWVVGSDADLVCFDAGSLWPLAGPVFDLVLCHDAFYFLAPKPEILARLRGLVRPGGLLAIGHVHNSEAANHSAGHGVTTGELAALCPHATFYDDDDLTRAAVEGGVPTMRDPADLRGVEAFGLVERGGGPDHGPAAPRAAAGPLCVPRAGAHLRRNPLYVDEDGGAAIHWPSDRYRDEYATRATYRARTDLPLWPEAPTAEQARRREVVDLPERW